jgi:hypothetical protein
MKYTQEMLKDAVAKSYSVCGVMKFLNIKLAGGSHSHITRKIKKLEVDTSHFTGRASNCGPDHKGFKKLRPEDVLIKRQNGRRQSAVILRRALIESGICYICAYCNMGDFWNGKELRLQVNHKNRDWTDDRIENLEFVCPNCHSQTEGWCGNKGGTSIISGAKGSRARRKLKGNISKYRKVKIIKTKKARPQKGKWPSINNLQDMMLKIPATEASKIIGVSSSAIKKKCKGLGIETRPRGYWAKCSSGGIADTMALEAIENNIS